MGVSKPHSALGELFVPRDPLLDVLERRFLAKEGTPWADIEELERQAFALVKSLQEQQETLREALREALDVIVWMSGATAFGPGGEAEQGWKATRDKLDRLFLLAASSPASSVTEFPGSNPGRAAGSTGAPLVAARELASPIPASSPASRQES